MRAAAAAFVFIVGAAVILVFANSLNSWVLGGLIGGLAALLISIPVSVMLFTIVSRRHDLKLQTLHQELGEMGYVAYDDHGFEEVYDTDAYVLTEEEYYRQNMQRRMTDVRALPAAGQSYASAHRELHDTMARPIQSGKRPSQALPQGRVKGSPTRDLSLERRQAVRSRHEVNAMRSRFHTAALQAAKREALQADESEALPNHTRVQNKQVPHNRISRNSGELYGSSRQARPGSDLARKQQSDQYMNTRSSLDNLGGKQGRAQKPVSSGERYIQDKTPQTDALYMNEFQSESLRMRSSSPDTDHLRVRPQTGKIIRNPQLGQSPRNQDITTGNLHTPLVRRAPYLYEDDPLREELAQQIDEEPIVRRSSRHLYLDDTD